VSKTTENILLIPGETGWETWTRQADEPFARVTESDSARAGDLKDLPAGDITMCFPARMVTALPVKVATEDESLFPDLVTLHAERLGLRADPLAGQLSDWFLISKSEESASLLSVFLKVPGEGDLPSRGPKGFDVSSRLYPVDGSRIAVWMEFGRWVFAFFQDGHLVYCQATGVESGHPDSALARDIQLAGMQLTMQGMDVNPVLVEVWSSQENLATGEFSQVLGLRCEVHPRPVPVLPQPLSRLLPADVRAARRAAQRKRNLITGIAAGVIGYLGLIGWLAFGLWNDHAETKSLLNAANQAAPDAEEYTAHIAKWDELAHAIDLMHSPVDILNRVAGSIPPNSGLRLKTADISAMEIKLMGEAQTLEAVNSFSLRLSNHNELMAFEWQTPEPNQSTRGWEFVFTAEVPLTETQE
jgi:hypothetical protein